jgi:glycosyltransferase involved in cell wall biosynthesis
MNNTSSISIITPSYNQAGFIGEALASVRLQGYENYEHLVIDGMSTDGTVDMLRNLATNGTKEKVFWLSEQDSGQSEALNKGFRRAKGEIVGWLNSDDRYLSGCFEHVVQAFKDNPEVDIVYGDYRIVDEVGKPIRIRREIEFSAFILLYHHVLYIPTTATFFRRRIFDENNLLEEKLQYAMDLDFFIRLSARGYRFKHIPKILADFRLQPTSKTCMSPDKQRAEHQQIVFAAAPIFHHVTAQPVRKAILSLLRTVAFARRCSEKMLKGYYWEQPRSSDSGLIGT